MVSQHADHGHDPEQRIGLGYIEVIHQAQSGFVLVLGEAADGGLGNRHVVIREDKVAPNVGLDVDDAKEINAVRYIPNNNNIRDFSHIST